MIHWIILISALCEHWTVVALLVLGVCPVTINDINLHFPPSLYDINDRISGACVGRKLIIIMWIDKD